MTWMSVPPDTEFPPDDLPYGVFSLEPEGRRGIGVAIGEWVLDLASALGDPVFAAPTLNGFMAQGRARWVSVRRAIKELLSDEIHRPLVEVNLRPRSSVQMHLPFEVADYVDHYASEDHATNLGRIFRPGQEPLTPNWKWVPIGYHGRAGTVVVSGTPIVRPSGQRLATTTGTPDLGPSQRLDFECEVGFVVGTATRLGDSVSVDDAREHIFGVVLVNDWSARDIQAWEYQPLGPYLGKSFATSISPWVVPLDALEQARVAPPRREPAPLPYLVGVDDQGLDIALEVSVNGTTIARPSYRRMYWSPEQMVAHMTINGAALRCGDLFASGTVSGPARHERGSLIELSWNGSEPVALADGTRRSFLEDGDTVRISGRAQLRDGRSLGFGEVVGRVIAARDGATEERAM